MALEKTIKIRVPTAQIKYVANKMEIDYEQVKDRMLEFLEYIQEQMITELILWINIYVPVRTGQTAWYLIEEGLQNIPSDYHFLYQASVALANIGNLQQALEMCNLASENCYIGQEEQQKKRMNS